MTVYRRGRVYWFDFVYKGKRVQRSTKQGNRRAADLLEAAERTRRALADGGVAEREPAPVFSEFAKIFLADVAKERTLRTARRYKVSLVSLQKWFGSKRLSEITAEQISQYKLKRLELGRSNATVNRDLACLRRMLGIAVKLDKLSRSPFLERRVEFLEEHGHERIVTFAEERVYLHAAGHTLRDVAALMLDLGLRPDEAFRIRRADVDLAERCLNVRSGKTKNAKRDLFLTDAALMVLKRRIGSIPLAGGTNMIGGPCLFPWRQGFAGYDWNRPTTQLWSAHRKALAASAIKPGFRLYDLRHTFATRALESGMDVLTLMRLMGHASLHTTNRYVHLTKRHLANAQKRVEAFRVERMLAEVESSAIASAERSARPQ